MTRSGEVEELDNFERDAVLIPLLVDDPLWVM